MRHRLAFGAPLARLGAAAARHPAIIHAAGALTIAIFLAYLAARIAITAVGSQPLAFWTLLLAESFALVTLVLFMYDSWRIPPTETPSPFDTSVDIVIATYDEDVSVLEPTIVSSLRVLDVRQVWVLDDGNRDQIRELCSQLGARYVARTEHEHAKAGNINHALPMMDAELLLFLDADHVPSRDIIAHMSGYFTDSRVAIVQSPHGFRNRDSSQHRDETRHEQSLFYEVLMPARAPSQSAFWSGSAAILRRSALMSVGGVATETLAEDLHTTLRLQRAGYLVRYHNEVLVSALAPHTTADYLLQRDRWARGTLGVLTSPESPVFGRGWRLRQRLHYLNNLLYYFIPFQRLAYVAVLLMLFLFGWLPIGNITPLVIGLLLLNLASNAVTSALFARGKRDAFDGSQFTWLSAAIHLKALLDVVRRKRTKFAVTPKVATQLSFQEKVSVLRLPLAVTTVLLAAWVYAGIRLLNLFPQLDALDPWLPGINDPEAFWWATFFLALELVTLERLLRREFKRRQVRTLWRFQTRMPASVAGEPVIITDIHESGVAFESQRADWMLGDEVTLTFSSADSPTLGKHARVRTTTVHGFVTPVRIVTLPDRIVSAGTLRWESDHDRWEAQDLCYSRLAMGEDHQARR